MNYLFAMFQQHTPSRFFFVLAGFLLAFSMPLHAQQASDLVQFSGLTLDGGRDELEPVPYVNILIQNRNRGTYSDIKGFFSIVAHKGDTIIFSAVGYKTANYIIPADLADDRYSLVQLMSRDVYNLPETVIFPWPSKDHFKLEFLAMDVTPELQDIAARNVATEAMKKMRTEVPGDGVETGSYYLRQQSRQTYYVGQTPPMNIFNPVSWKKFFDAWKNGDFKRKN